ncbi:MAG: hypothetical protein ABEJ43_00930 [Haloferacaceae archaeon]
MSVVQRAAVDRACSADDPALARRHLRLVAALDGVESADPLTVSLAVVADLRSRPAPPTPPTPGTPVDDPAVRGGAVAVARFGRSLDAVAASADLPRAAVREALALV